MLIEARRSRLVLVDLQTRLYAAMTPSSPNFLARILLLARAAAALNVPALATRQYPRGLGPLLPGLAQVLADSVPIFDKMTFSCCADSVLSEALGGDRDQVLLAGIETHVCVLQTALDLKASGREVYVIADACASRAPEDHRQALERMGREGVRLASVESTVFEWLRDARHPHFRELACAIRDLPKMGPDS
ncbi:isochorismatase family protein [Acidiferrobacter sp.]|uniref:isochorismatase family protein n=1 Tax=Acidiferrobacter sp. TaxID=1872107 RepID=UPI002631CF29|nr:isochorismatase family protein [Acidiferrobacter sp.]